MILCYERAGCNFRIRNPYFGCERFAQGPGAQWHDDALIHTGGTGRARGE